MGGWPELFTLMGPLSFLFAFIYTRGEGYIIALITSYTPDLLELDCCWR